MLATNTAFEPEDDGKWHFIPGSSQEHALEAECNELLLTGGRGWGKTETQLMKFAMQVGRGYGTHWRGVIFDREYKNLDDLLVKSKRIFKKQYGNRCRFLSSNSDFKWVWDTGEELLFRVARVDDDYWSYHGHEYPFVGWNELTKYPNGNLYSRMRSVNRSGFINYIHTPKLTGEISGNMTDVEAWNYAVDEKTKEPLNWHYEGRPFEAGDYMTPDGRPLPEIPLQIISTTNPYGAGHNWVKQEFIDPAPYGVVIEIKTEIYNPRTKQDEVITRTRLTLFGTFRENPYLSPEYIAGLYAETDENILKAWLKGNWDIVAGGALDDKWVKRIHVIPRFKVPRSWYVDRAFDWGSTHPYSVGWFCEANGEEVICEDGTKITPPRGTLIQVAELYGTKKLGTNIGVKHGAKQIAKDILAVEASLKATGYVTGIIWPGPADNQIAEVREITTDSYEKMMAAEGVSWEKSDKSSGSRKIGLQLIRDRLEASIKKEGPGLLFCSNCIASISTIPVLARDDKDPDDVETTQEDHPYDMVRYRVLKGNNKYATVVAFRFPR